jgi:hypothetical protein
LSASRPPNDKPTTKALRSQPVEVAGRFHVVRGCAVPWQTQRTDREPELLVQSLTEVTHDLRGPSEGVQNENSDIATLERERLGAFHNSHHEAFLLVGRTRATTTRRTKATLLSSPLRVKAYAARGLRKEAIFS